MRINLLMTLLFIRRSIVTIIRSLILPSPMEGKEVVCGRLSLVSIDVFITLLFNNICHYRDGSQSYFDVYKNKSEYKLCPPISLEA